MANLSIADDEGSRKLTGGSNKPNVPSKPGCPNTDASPLPLTAAPHINTIESLRQELLGKISGQADDIRKLKSSNAGLISKVNGLSSSNADASPPTAHTLLVHSSLLYVLCFIVLPVPLVKYGITLHYRLSTVIRHDGYLLEYACHGQQMSALLKGSTNVLTGGGLLESV
ncbi:hypothetical protein PILCRDRAFT_733296 [Piloderma croceum F 1598]|uniref:Uncharacterized protein n=1 Tax=Piloderma croceum (strain F 1598) TaxID=765440 RepID=A0A0C3EKL9_PILCF|nr:hypothetical protein PILCRDRAFT_733296 [Piloderma croceum F 1598]